MAKEAVKKQSFGSILSMPVEDAVRPPTLPKGFYLCVVESFREDKSSQKQTPYTEFQLKVIEPWEKEGIIQVDEEALEEYGDVRGAILNVQFYQTEKSVYRLREFLEHCGVDFSDRKSFEQAIPEARNCQLIARVTHQTAQDGDATYARVSRTLPIPEEK